MKHIGLVDDYISEWHANNYPTWIAEIAQELGTDWEVRYAWAERNISPVDGVSTDEWCQKMSVTRCATIEELCKRSDAVIILAPSTPERHLHYAKAVLPWQKPTYIDKTFAPNLAVAKEIFALAEEYGTPFFSTSALRCAEELERFSDVKNLIVTGGGSSLEEYVVHLTELAVILLRDQFCSVTVVRQGKQRIFHLNTEKDKCATLIFTPRMPFVIESENEDGISTYASVKSDFFRHLMRDILQFFDSGKPPFDPAETLEVMRVRDMILKADAET